MRANVENLAVRLAGVISSWRPVEAVCLGEHSENDLLDPYFALVMDAYHRGGPPSVAERRAAIAASFGDPGAFESSQAGTKDRFFIEEVPVRVEYKSVERFDEILVKGAAAAWADKEAGTYMFYRLQNSRVLFKRSAWVEEARAKLLGLGGDFWVALRTSFVTKMEHFLSDLGAAAMRDDDFFFAQSASGFARSAASALFMSNRRFEPSPRAVGGQIGSLASLPGDFAGRWETFLRTDVGLSKAQKYELAQLIAKSVLILG